MLKWLRGGDARERQLRRLAVIDAARVDRGRSVVLVRRDNFEHLLLIGGPIDVVIEPNIVRTGAPAGPTAPRPARIAAELFDGLSLPEVPPSLPRGAASRGSASTLTPAEPPSSPQIVQNLEELTA